MDRIQTMQKKYGFFLCKPVSEMEESGIVCVGAESVDL